MGVLKQLFIFLVFLIILLLVDVSDGGSGPTHNKVVVCSIATWSVYRPGKGKFEIEDLDPTLCTHVIYAYAGLNVTTDAIRSLDPWQDLSDDYGKDGYNRLVRLKQEYPHLKVSIAIGGWNEGSTKYSRLAADPDRRIRFIASVLGFLKKYKFDGLDLNWKYPTQRGGVPQDKANFLFLVKELRGAFNKYDYLLTAAFNAKRYTIDKAYEVGSLSTYLDFIYIVCYDYHGAWDSKTGANSPLRSSDFLDVETSINYIIKLGANPRKLVLGLPLYGRTFVVDNTALITVQGRKLGEISGDRGFQGPYTKEDGFIGYNEICLDLKNNSLGYIRYWDDESKTPFTVSGEKVISYDDLESITEKMNFAIEKGLAGCMVWSVDTDDFHGDCSDEKNVDGNNNYPLLRTVNKAIEQALEDIKRNKTNETLHNQIENEDKESSAVNKLNYTSLIILVVIVEVYQYQLF